VQSPVSRNAPCPCGSGRRFKECHGAASAPAGASAASQQRDTIAIRKRQALAAQQRGAPLEAIELYREILAEAPDDFDSLHMCGVAYFQRGEFERSLALIDRALRVNPGVEAARFNRRLAADAIDRRVVETELERAAHEWPPAVEDGGGFAAGGASTADDASVRVIAFYLPQFHAIPENDAWWGQGFTEWTNVRRARANFVGQWQPHEPAELGYYDLTDASVRDAQAKLARQHGVDAFCYYYYWFSGKRLLDRPLAEMAASGQPDFPFCVCWANENWTRRWDGLEHEILIAQQYSRDDGVAFIRSLFPLFDDRRYLRVGGRPLLLVYNIGDIPNIAQTVSLWRETARREGPGEIYLAAVQRNALDDPTSYGFDAAVEFPPLGHAAENRVDRIDVTNPAFRGTVFGYASLAAHYLMLPRPAYRQFRGVTPMWDNTARRQNEGMVVVDSSPELFGVWLGHAIAQTRLRHRGDERLLFVNAWNEWAEGNHLEPDRRYGRRYLEAVRAARSREFAPTPARPAFADIERDTASLIASGAIRLECFGASGAKSSRFDGNDVSLVMPLYNHARYLPRTLASIAAQTLQPRELIVVDDGSTDGGAEIVAEFARRVSFPVTLVSQANAGADAALNRGMAVARGDIVAVINSDDTFHPERLERLVAALAPGTDLAFSDTSFIGDDDATVDNAYTRTLRRRIDEGIAAPNLLYPLIEHNIAISTGNLLFRRNLLRRIGGFAPMRVCHDWDFLLAATYVTRLAFVDERLYQYRLHGDNTFAALTLGGRIDGERVLDSFFAGIHGHPWLVASDARATFLRYARNKGLGAVIPAVTAAQGSAHPPPFAEA
jgi:glycosyltransferase involved in cell wall biosynthesis/tetratricopeptide (TPR) repeat protein